MDWEKSLLDLDNNLFLRQGELQKCLRFRFQKKYVLSPVIHSSKSILRFNCYVTGSVCSIAYCLRLQFLLSKYFHPAFVKSFYLRTSTSCFFDNSTCITLWNKGINFICTISPSDLLCNKITFTTFFDGIRATSLITFANT
jgi:hypothetical protein